MYINQVDNLFDEVLNKLNIYLLKEKAFEKLLTDTNFVKFQNEILSYIKKFIDSIPKNNIINIIKKDSYYEPILNIIKRYCAFYIYLGIAYYYNGNRDLYITNILEASRYQKDSVIQISNFFNSENNAKLIKFYNDIKNFLSLLQFKTIDKIKIVLSNNPLKYESTIKLFNDLGEDYVIDYFLIKDNFHNIIKSLIFKQIYLKEEQNEIIKMLNQQEKEEAEYKYIEIVVSNEKKIVDFNVIQKFLTTEQLRSGLAEEIYSYLQDYRDIKEIIIKENQDFINYLFTNEIIIPITEDFLRYHKDTEKYDPESLIESENIKEREATKIKYIMSKMNNIKNYNSPSLEKNPKLKLDTEKYFFKQLDPKMAILFNEYEEIKIIQKLESSNNPSDYDLLMDLENVRKYAYVNFKHFSSDGIKLRPPTTIQAIRKTSLKERKSQPIHLRIGHDNIDINMIGIAWNPFKTPLDCFNAEDLINTKKLVKEENGYKAFIKVMNKTFDSDNLKHKKLYYWLFNNKTDIPQLDSYVNYNENDVQKNIKIMIEEIYKNYINLVKTKIHNYINKTEEFTIWDFDNLLKLYYKKYFNWNLNPELKNELIEKVIIEKIPELEVIEDDVDSMIPGKRDIIIRLPTIDISKYKKNIVSIGVDYSDVTIDISNKNMPICHHYIKWKNIMSISRKSEDFNQAVFNFVKQYIKVNKQGDYICKSCNEMVQLQKFVVEGTYIEELDTFLTTSLTVSQRLEEIPKYTKYMRSIRNIEKNIEKFAYSLDIISYIGNTPVIKLRRKLVIKDTIDLILLHTEWLRKQPKDRIEQYSKKYGTGKDLTNLFFFEFKDDIFLTSSKDTDYYKLIKYNNIMAYLILVMILELNSGQILSLREDKRYNYFFFEKIGQSLFGELFLRVSQKEKIPLLKLPLFSYILYYFSGLTVSNRFWLYNDSDVEAKNKQLYIINLQKTVIHTVIDLINSLMEANFEANKNFLYEIITTRINIKLNHTFNDQQLLKRLQLVSMKNIKFDETTKKVTFLTKKINLIDINNEYNTLDKVTSQCLTKTVKLDNLERKSESNNIDILTNCADGKFHKWTFKNGDLICSLCNKSYNELLKLYNNTSSEKPNFDYLDRIKLINLRKLAKKYCMSGILHELDTTGKCSKCNININTYDFSDKELKQLEKNLDNKTNEDIIKQINKLKEYNQSLEDTQYKTKKIINKILKRYEKETEGKLDNYVNNFIKRLSKTLGNKIKVGNKTIYLKDTIIIIDHDYYGNLIKTPLYILESEDKIQFIKNHRVLNRDVLYYKDKSNNIYVYYDSITLQYLGYSEDNKNIKKTKNNASLIVELSIKDSIMLLGYENRYINLHHINKDYQTELPSELGDQTKEVIIKIVRNRINNLKQILSRVQSIIYNIRNSGQVISNYNYTEKEIVTEFTKKLKNFNTIDPTGHNTIFKHHKQILTKLPISYNIPDNLNIKLNNNYFDVNNLVSLNNSDNKLIFYLIYNLNKLLDYNKQPAIESELSHLLIKIIRFAFNLYNRPYSNYNIRKFDLLLVTEAPYVDETIKVVGHYQELLTQQEINDPDRKENEYSSKQETEALDIDDYEVNDDIDETAEALDGYEN